MQLYVRAKSKKELNERIEANNINLYGIEYTPFDQKVYRFEEWIKGTTIKVFDKIVMGNPYAKAYGVFNGKKVL